MHEEEGACDCHIDVKPRASIRFNRFFISFDIPDSTHKTQTSTITAEQDDDYSGSDVKGFAPKQVVQLSGLDVSEDELKRYRRAIDLLGLKQSAKSVKTIAASGAVHSASQERDQEPTRTEAPSSAEVKAQAKRKLKRSDLKAVSPVPSVILLHTVRYRIIASLTSSGELPLLAAPSRQGAS